MESEETFGRWIRRLRKELDLTQEQLADQVGCSVETISKIEAGQRRPSRLLAERMARVLDLTSEEQARFVQAARARPSQVSSTELNALQSREVHKQSGFPTYSPTAAPEPSNPFFHRGPVRDPAYFFGRAREVAFVADLLRQRQSVTISGPRRFGKTSLLFHLAHPDVATLHGLGADTTRWVYLDGGTLSGLDEEWFYGAVDRACGGQEDAVPYTRFVERLRGLGAQGIRLILALDEFELVAANPHFGQGLFNRLRGLAAQFPLQFVTASKAALVELTFAHRETLSSPFFNIFAPLQLGLLAEAEAVELLAELSARGGHDFTPNTRAYLLGLAGPHPLFLQVAGYRAFAAFGDRRGDLDAEAYARVRAETLADLEPHLRYYWSSLDSEAQYTLAALPLLPKEGRAAPIEHLNAAGLLRGQTYLGGVLEDFVRRQTVDGLLQGGPFIVDLRRGQVAVRDGQVHLTATEFAALKLLLEHPGRLLTAEEIESALWPGEIASDPERARGVVKKLRAALGPAGEAIVNRRGQGYLLSLD
jgi:transcriptional regulator with XRE-family HTH domain